MKILVKGTPPPREKPAWEDLKLKCAACKSVVQLEESDRPVSVSIDFTLPIETFKVGCPVCRAEIRIQILSEWHARTPGQKAYIQHHLIIPPKHKPPHETPPFNPLPIISDELHPPKPAAAAVGPHEQSAEGDAGRPRPRPLVHATHMAARQKAVMIPCGSPRTNSNTGHRCARPSWRTAGGTTA